MRQNNFYLRILCLVKWSFMCTHEINPFLEIQRPSIFHFRIPFVLFWQNTTKTRQFINSRVYLLMVLETTESKQRGHTWWEPSCWILAWQKVSHGEKVLCECTRGRGLISSFRHTPFLHNKPNAMPVACIHSCGILEAPTSPHIAWKHHISCTWV